MICPSCGGHLRVRQTYNAGDLAKTQRAVCESCRTVCVIVSHIAEVNPDIGAGAAALAKRISGARQKNPPSPGG